MNGDEPPVKMRGCLARGMVALVIGFIVLSFVTPKLEGDRWCEEFIYHLAVGSMLHANRAFAYFATDLPQLVTAALLPGLATVIALCGAHRLALWWRHATGKGDGWRFRHTVLVGLLVLLGSAAAIALSGVLHELAWLSQGKIIYSNIRNPGTYARITTRQLGLSLFEYESEHGTYPPSLLDLEKIEKNPANLRQIMFVELDPPSPPEPFIFLGSGKPAAGNPSRLLAISPVIPEWDVFMVLRMDNSVTSIPASKLAEVLKSAAGENPEGK